MNWLKVNRVSAKDPLSVPPYDLSLPTSFGSKYKLSKSIELKSSEKIKSNPSFSLEKINSKTIDQGKGHTEKTTKKRENFHLPLLKRNSVQNPQSKHEEKSPSLKSLEVFYQSHVFRALKTMDNSYIMNLSRQHFRQTVQALRMTRNIELIVPKKEIKLQKISPHKKTIYLDLDETLIHTDERSNNYSIKLSFPIDTGGSIEAGVRIRPHCRQFLTQLASFAEIIIFTASSPSYANVILDYLDPNKKFFSHRLYRNHCTLEKGFYVKDLRCVNRNLSDVAIVDNSAFSFFLQPENGIPIIPFYHYSKDHQLQALLPFLRQLVQAEDMRTQIMNTFFWDAYLKEHGDIKKIFFRKMKKKDETK